MNDFTEEELNGFRMVRFEALSSGARVGVCVTSGSLRELIQSARAWQTDPTADFVRIIDVPDEGAGPEIWSERRDRNRGLYRESDGWVMVSYADGRQAMSIPRDAYDDNRYEPPYNELLTKTEFDKINAQRT